MTLSPNLKISTYTWSKMSCSRMQKGCVLHKHNTCQGLIVWKENHWWILLMGIQCRKILETKSTYVCNRQCIVTKLSLSPMTQLVVVLFFYGRCNKHILTTDKMASERTNKWFHPSAAFWTHEFPGLTRAWMVQRSGTIWTPPWGLRAATALGKFHCC